MTIKEAAVEILKTHCSSCYTRGCKTCAYNTAMLAMLHPSANWTPCSVALPEDQSDVLIYFDRCGGEIGIGYYAERADGVKFWCAMGSMLCYNVLAWQPLPEPYRGEAREMEQRSEPTTAEMIGVLRENGDVYYGESEVTCDQIADRLEQLERENAELTARAEKAEADVEDAYQRGYEEGMDEVRHQYEEDGFV